MSDEKKKPPIPQAKRHHLLAAIDSELRGKHFKKTFNVYGRDYTLSTLSPDDERWADALVHGDNVYQIARNRRAAYVAASVCAIDNVPIEDLFDFPEDLDPIERRILEDNPETLKAWRRGEVFRWLTDQEKHGALIEAIHAKYLEIDIQRANALEALDPLPKKMATGATSGTSSPEKESSSATQASPG